MFEELNSLKAARERERKMRDALEYKKDKYKQERDELARLRDDFEKEAKKEVKKNRELSIKLAAANKTTQKLSEDAVRLKSMADAMEWEAKEGRQALEEGRKEYVRERKRYLRGGFVLLTLVRTRFARTGTRS